VQGTPLPPPATPLPFPTAGATPTFAPPPPIVTTTAPAAEGTPTPATSPYPGGGAGSPTPSPAATNVTGFSVVSAGDYLDATGLLTVMGEVRNSSGNAAGGGHFSWPTRATPAWGGVGWCRRCSTVPAVLERVRREDSTTVSGVAAARRAGPPAAQLTAKTQPADHRRQPEHRAVIFNVQSSRWFDPPVSRAAADGDPDRTTLNPSNRPPSS
jgi:hypothetical protein